MNKICIGIGLLLWVGCTTDPLSRYHGNQALYFKKSWEGEVAYSFTRDATIADDETYIAIPVVMLGGVAGVNTPVVYHIRYEADDLELVGKVGMVAQEELLFQKGQYADTIMLPLLRTEILEDTLRTIRLTLGTSKPFDSEIAVADELGYFKTLELVVDDVYPQPDSWPQLQPYLGSFSSKKMRVIGREFFDQGYPWQRILSVLQLIAISGEQRALGEQLLNYLETQAQNGAPVLERDGTPMEAGPLMY